ncbi:MAG: ABC transporter substrate-binding protein [Rhizobiales bacterium]|nr:ABC transporter substrate-binding protein [Hyphomicrobiales bacterium]
MKFVQSRRDFAKTLFAGAALVGLGPLGRAQAAETTPLNFQSIWINDPEFMGYFIAIDEGYYKAEGLDVNYISGGPDVIPPAAWKQAASSRSRTSSARQWPARRSALAPSTCCSASTASIRAR